MGRGAAVGTSTVAPSIATGYRLALDGATVEVPTEAPRPTQPLRRVA